MRAATRRRLVAALASLGALTALVVLLFPLPGGADTTVTRADPPSRSNNPGAGNNSSRARRHCPSANDLASHGVRSLGLPHGPSVLLPDRRPAPGQLLLSALAAAAVALFARTGGQRSAAKVGRARA
jgi:hypothetical protein